MSYAIGDATREIEPFNLEKILRAADCLARIVATSQTAQDAVDVWRESFKSFHDGDEPELKQQLMIALPRIYLEAREDATRLLATCTISNAALMEADEEGKADDAVDAEDRFIRHNSSLAQAMELGRGVFERVRLEAKDETLGKLLGELQAVWERATEPTPSLGSVPNGSTSSPRPTRGAAAKSSRSRTAKPVTSVA